MKGKISQKTTLNTDKGIMKQELNNSSYILGLSGPGLQQKIKW